MTAREAHQAQWQALKDKPLSNKLKYIFTYYWPGILGVICVIAFAVSWIGGILTQKDTALAGYLINGTVNPSYSGNLRADFMAHQQLDSNQYEFNLTSDVEYNPNGGTDAALYVLESIVVQAATGELDFIVTNLDTYPVFSAYYKDLKAVLSAQQLEKWQNSLVYVEKEALDYLISDEFDEFEIPKYYLSTEGLKNPIAVGVRLPSSSSLFDAYAFPPGDVIFGIVHNAKNIENTLAFLEYVMN